jgi:hypothetical protein
MKSENSWNKPCNPVCIDFNPLGNPCPHLSSIYYGYLAGVAFWFKRSWLEGESGIIEFCESEVLFTVTFPEH